MKEPKTQMLRFAHMGFNGVCKTAESHCQQRAAQAAAVNLH